MAGFPKNVTLALVQQARAAMKFESIRSTHDRPMRVDADDEQDA